LLTVKGLASTFCHMALLASLLPHFVDIITVHSHVSKPHIQYSYAVLIQLSPTLIKLCHVKRDHSVIFYFYISLEK